MINIDKIPTKDRSDLMFFIGAMSVDDRVSKSNLIDLLDMIVRTHEVVESMRDFVSDMELDYEPN